jgi:hypothetical protein
MDQEKSEQISQFGGTEIQINEVISQQDAIEGRKKKEVNVQGYSHVLRLTQLLKNVTFPAPKSKVLQQVRLSEDFENKENVIKAKALHDLEERSYNNISDVTIAAGLVHNVKLPSL